MMKRKMILILTIFMAGTEFIAVLKPTCFLIGCLMVGIFILIYYVPIFHDFASMYALVLSYVFGFVPVTRRVISILKKQEIIGYDSNVSNVGQFILTLGISLLMLHFLSLVCSYIAGFIWSKQKTLVYRTVDDEY